MGRRYKVIACKVFKTALNKIGSDSVHEFDIELLQQDAHDYSDYLRSLIKEAIDRTEVEGGYDAILLAYGLCGNGISDLEAKTIPLVVPRAHDCCTLFLGSRELFSEHFKDNPSRPFSSPGYINEGRDTFHETTMDDVYGNGRTWEDLVAEYGEENAQFVKDTLISHTPGRDRVVYIRDPWDNPPGLEDKVRVKAENEGLGFQLIEGSNRLLEKLLNGPWDEEFLMVSPGEKIVPIYDWEDIIKAELK